jgi:uncharacterized protein (DUF2461 family)
MRPILPAVIRFGRPPEPAGDTPPELAAAHARITDLQTQLADLANVLAVAQADLRRATAREDHLRLGMADLRAERDQLRRALDGGPHDSGNTLVDELRRENTRLRRVAEQDRRNALRLEDRLAQLEGRAGRCGDRRARDEGNWQDHAWTGRP